MQRFLRIATDENKVFYLNYDRIERIEIQLDLKEAAVVMSDRHEPITVRGNHYAALIEHLGHDQEPD